MQKEKTKFMSYFNLRDALAQPGCPICTLVERVSSRYLDSLLYERVNDVGTREDLRESLGFCNWHAWKALEIGSFALGMGILYGDILEQVEARLDKVRDSLPLTNRASSWIKFFRPSPKVSSPSALRPQRRCPACRRAGFFERVYLQTLLDFISEEDFANPFSLSAGICFPHLIAITENFPYHPNLPLLVRKQIDKLQSLRGEVAEFVRKQDYHFFREPRGAEVDSWKRAMEMVVGRREIFPSQMDRGGREEEAPFEEESPVGMSGETEEIDLENEKLRRRYESRIQEYESQRDGLTREIGELKRLLKLENSRDKSLDPKDHKG